MENTLSIIFSGIITFKFNEYYKHFPKRKIFNFYTHQGDVIM